VGVQGGEADACVVGTDPDAGTAGQWQVLAHEVGEPLVDLHHALPGARAGHRHVAGKRERAPAQVGHVERCARFGREIEDVAHAADVFELEVCRVRQIDVRLRCAFDQEHPGPVAISVGEQFRRSAGDGRRSGQKSHRRIVPHGRSWPGSGISPMRDQKGAGSSSTYPGGWGRPSTRSRAVSGGSSGRGWPAVVGTVPLPGGPGSSVP
jgi:hypothetical protein